MAPSKGLPIVMVTAMTRAETRSDASGSDLPELPPVLVAERPRIFAGHGDSRPCSYCSLPIAAKDVQYEVENHPPRQFEPTGLRFHIRCFDAWIAAGQPQFVRRSG